MNVNQLTCYFDPERGECCVNVNGNDEFRFNTPQAAGKCVADWLTLAQRRQRTDAENRQLADLAYEKFDFGWQIKDACGWESQTNDNVFERTVFVENEDDPDGPSLRKRFHVEVRSDTVYAALVESHSESWPIKNLTKE